MKPFPRSVYAVALCLLGILPACDDATSGPTAGDLSVEVTGLPGGSAAAVTITGPSAFSRQITTTESFSDMAAGEYTITAATVTVGSVGYGATAETQTITVSPGAPKRVTVDYVNLNTTLTIDVRGLPSGTTPTLRVTGPNGFDRTIDGTTRLAGLSEGSYTVAGAGYLAGDSTYQARPIRQDYVMTGLYPGSASVAYSAAGHRSLNFRVSRMYLLNAVQTSSGSIPLVADRDAYLRVFVTADQANTAAPWVRVRVYDAATVRRTLYLSPGGASVPTATEEGTLERSWNVVVPAELVRAGMRIEAEVDPENGVVESNESDNLFPAAGGPMAVSVVSPRPLRIRFVPVQQGAAGQTGGVSAANMESFLRFTRKVYPIPSAIEADVRAPYVNTGTTLDADGGGWLSLLSELEAVRVAEGAASSHYVGVVRVGYRSGVAGMAFVPSDPEPGGTSLSWDYLPSADEVVAHELGHNFGRLHAPCPTGPGAPSGVDPGYPYGGGTIGVFGYDILTNSLKRPDATANFDVMGYCERSWISDYTYEAVRAFRAAAVPAARSSVQPTVLVWGRVDGGGVVLEPAFQLRTRPSLPAMRGRYTAEGLDASGAVLFSHRFDANAVADAEGDERLFAVAVPLAADRAGRLATIRVRGDGREAVVRSSGVPVAERGGVGVRGEAFSLEPDGGGTTLRWNRESHPMVLVRDAGSGEIVSFARGGRVNLPAARRDLELVISDGVRSVSRRVDAGFAR